MQNSMRTAILIVALFITGFIFAYQDQFLSDVFEQTNQQEISLAVKPLPAPTPEVLQPSGEKLPEYPTAPMPIAQLPDNQPMVYACKNSSGTMEFQQKPCADSAQTMAVVEQMPVVEPVITPHIQRLNIDFDAVDRAKYGGGTVAVMGSTSQKSNASECKFIEDNRDYVRSQQRVNSTQHLRDQYDYWTKRRNDAKC